MAAKRVCDARFAASPVISTIAAYVAERQSIFILSGGESAPVLSHTLSAAADVTGWRQKGNKLRAY